MKKFYAYSSRFRENRFPVYVIADQDPSVSEDWNDVMYEREFLGCFFAYSDALSAVKSSEPDFDEYEELDDSFLQGEIVFVHR